MNKATLRGSGDKKESMISHTNSIRSFLLQIPCTGFVNLTNRSAHTKPKLQTILKCTTNLNRSIITQQAGVCRPLFDCMRPAATFSAQPPAVEQTTQHKLNAVLKRDLATSSVQQTPTKTTPIAKKKMTKLNEQERTELLQPLLKAGWSLVNDRDAIHKEYLFKDFNQAFSFMSGVALLAEKANHHPEWFNVYNKVQVTMSTHDVGGLSAKDIRMATYMEEQAKRFV